MAKQSFVQVLGLVASQLEAASSLLRYAADDMQDLQDRPDVLMREELALIVQNLAAQCAIIDGNAAFCIRLSEEAANGTDQEDSFVFDDFSSQANSRDATNG